MMKNQEHMKSALDKIEGFSKQSAEKLKSIELHISESIISGTTSIKDELKTQTGILNGILTQLGGKKVETKKDDIKKSQTNGNFKELSDQAATTDITSFAKVLLLLGGAFWAFGKGIGSLEDISLKQVTVFGVMLLSIFGAISLIFKQGMDISIIQAAELIVISAMLAMMVTDVSRILSKMEMPSLAQLGMAVGIGAVMVPLAMYVIQTMDELSAFSGGTLFDLIQAPIVAISSMGALIMLPMLALSIVATANVLRMMPSSLSTSALALALGVGIAMLPIAHVFVAIFKALRGVMGTQRLYSAIASRIGAGTTNPLGVMASAGAALAIIPIVALAVVATAWIFQALPKTFKIPPLAWVLKLSVILLTFSAVISAMQKNMNAMTGVMMPVTGANGKTRNIRKGKGDFYRLISAVFIIGISIVAISYIFKALPDTYKAPPLGWIIKVGVAMFIFAKSIKSILLAMKGRINKKKVLLAGAVMLIMASAIVAISYIFMAMPPPNFLKAPPLGWTIKVGIAMFIFAKSINSIMLSLKGRNSDKKLKQAGLALLVLATSIVAISYIFMALPDANRIKAPSIIWTIAAGLAMYLFSKALQSIMISLKGRDTGKKLKEAGLGMVVLAMSIVAVAFVFMLLPDKNRMKSPPISWTFKAGLSLWIFSKAVGSIMESLKGRGKKKKLMEATAALLVLAAGVVAVSYIFQLLPDRGMMKSPPLAWTISVGIAMVAFAYSTGIIMNALKGRGKKNKLIEAMLAIGLIAASIVAVSYIFQFLPSKDKMKSPPLLWIISVGLTMVAFSAALFAIMKLNIKPKDAIKAVLVFNVIAASLVTIAWITQALPNIYKAPPIEWVLSMTLALITFGGIFIGIGFLYKKVISGAAAMIVATSAIYILSMAVSNWAKANIEWSDVIMLSATITGVGAAMAFAGMGPIPKAIKKGASSMILATSAIYILAEALSVWTKANIKWEDIAMLGVAVIGVAVIMAFAGMGPIPKAIIKGAAAMILATIPIAVLAATMIIWSKANVEWSDVAMLSATVLGIGLVMAFAGMGPIPLFIAVGSLVMTLATIPIILLAAAMNIWTKADVTWESIGILAALVTGLGAGMAAAGLASPFILLGSAAMLVAGSALVTIASGYASFAEVYKNNPEILTGTIVKDSITNLVEAFNIPLKQTARIYAVAPALILAGESLISIGKGLQQFAKMDLDVGVLGQKIGIVVTSVADAFAEIGKKYGNTFLNKGPVAKGIDAVKGMGKQLSQIAKGVQDFADLKYKLNGKEYSIPESWLSPGGKISMNIRNVLKVVGDEFAELGRTNGETTWFSSGMIKKGIISIKGAGKQLSEIAAGVQAFANLKYKLNGKDYSIPEDWLQPGGKVSMNIRNVLKVVGQEFAELGRTNGETGWFSSGLVEKGINSIKGAGEELGAIASAVMNFANLKYTLNGKEFTLTPDQLGVYDENGKLIKEGSVYRNMRNAILAITGVLGDVGKSPDTDSGPWWWPGKSNLEKGKKAILGATEGLGEVASFIQSVGKIEDIDKLESNVTKILRMLPAAVMGAYNHMTESGIDIEDASLMLSKYPSELADAVERIAKHESAIEKVANSFEKMSTSIIDMKEAVQVIDENKLFHLSTMFDSVNNIQKMEAESKSKSGVAKDVAKGIEKGMDKVMEVIGKFNKTSTNQTAEIKKLADKEINIPGTNVVVDNKELVKAMKQMIAGLEDMSNKLDEVPVRVMNQNDSIQ